MRSATIDYREKNISYNTLRWHHRTGEPVETGYRYGHMRASPKFVWIFENLESYFLDVWKKRGLITGLHSRDLPAIKGMLLELEKYRKITLADGRIMNTEMTKKQRLILEALNLMCLNSSGD